MLNIEHYTVLTGAPIKFDRGDERTPREVPSHPPTRIRKPDARHL